MWDAGRVPAYVRQALYPWIQALPRLIRQNVMAAIAVFRRAQEER